MSANDRQEGGDHYKSLRGMETWDIITAWGLGFLDGNALKYISRWRKKGGIEDLKKAIHYLEKQIEVEEAKKMPAAASSEVIAGAVTPVAFTSREGHDWKVWNPAWGGLPVERFRLRRAAKELNFLLLVTTKNIPVEVHALQLSNSRVWDIVNGWRDNHQSP
jgi:hypothetical protein